MLLTMERYETIRRFTGIEMRVLLNGVEVTRDCAAAYSGPPELGWVVVMVRDADGNILWNREHGDRSDAVREIKTGSVIFTRKAEEVERG